MVLIIAPAIDGLRREWREAAENLGASSRQYWQRVALPILMPTLLGTIILLFGNAFGAQATAYQLTSGLIPLVPLLIGNQISGDVLHNPGLGYAMAMGMVVIMAGLDRRLHRAPAPSRAVAAMKRRRGGIAWWLVFLLAVLYFFLPLYATLAFSLKAKPRVLGLHQRPVGPQVLRAASATRWSSASSTIVASLALIVPTAYWVQLARAARPISSSSS